MFDVDLVGDFFELLHHGEKIARLNKKFCSQARQLCYFGVQFQAHVLETEWVALLESQNKHSATSVTMTFAVEVNICSFRNHADHVGDLLSLAGLFLQDPVYDPDRSPYHNPQKVKFEGVVESAEMSVTPADLSTAEHIHFNTSADLGGPVDQDPHPQTTDLVDSILNSLSHNGILHEISTDQNRIKTTLYP